MRSDKKATSLSLGLRIREKEEEEEECTFFSSNSVLLPLKTSIKAGIKKSTSTGAAETCKHGSNGYIKRTSLCATKERHNGMTMHIIANCRCMVTVSKAFGGLSI